MGVVLLDSTVLIDALRGRPAAARVLGLRNRGDVPVTSSVNVEEIVRGLRRSEQDAVERLFDGLRVVPLRRTEAERAGR
ncbi:PIN domain-containing protein [Geodermatophilus sp. DF01_2]|uniref:PIN domain-containing protein n=1 Tax=Geodermatophilus sp. DF01-2 TaxID=2559610 RepID=UPI0014317A69|nr:PIN domain-containing protein [Geodermatophilus sp. DF01_2]